MQRMMKSDDAKMVSLSERRTTVMPQQQEPLAPPLTTHSTWIAASALLTACGGGDQDTDWQQAMRHTAEAPTRHLLGVPSPSDANPALPTPDELLDWAERTYPQFFPGHQLSLNSDPYVYRHYGKTGNYVGLSGTDIYVLGPLSGNALLRVGSLAEFAPRVLATLYAASDMAAARFLQQAQFASTSEDIADVRRLGYVGWLQAQFAQPLGETAWDWLQARGYGSIDEQRYHDGGGPVFDFAAYRQMLSAPDALRKRIQLTLTEYFVVSLAGGSPPWPHFTYATFWDGLGQHAYGNFRDLLEQVTLSAAMGWFLSTAGNRKEDPSTGRVPDENYAREVMQLFTIGLYELNVDGTQRFDQQGRPIETYSNDDVTQLARVFTGYSLDVSGPSFVASVGNHLVPTYPYSRRPMAFDPAQHSTLKARFLGTTVPAGTGGPQAMKMALDALFQHANVGPFLGRQLIQRLVTSDPSPAFVGRVAAAFNDNGTGTRGDMKAVISAVLLDVEARGDPGEASLRFGKLREVPLRLIQWARTFGLRSKAGSWKYGFPYGDPTYDFGQRLFWSPTVFNFFRPGFVPPGTALAASGSTAPEFQLVNEATVAQYINLLEQQLLNGPWIFAPDRRDNDQSVPSAASGIGDMTPDYSREKAVAHDLASLLDRLNLLMCAGRLSDRTRQRLMAALATFSVSQASSEKDKQGRVAQALLMIMICPEYLVQK